jgi:hypothetical protein
MNTDYFSRTRRLFLSVGFCAVTTLACAAETPVDIVQRLDAARLKAMGASDGAALAKILSDEVLFIHSDGRIEAKADYIKNMTAGDTAYTDLKTADVQARQIAADVVVLAGAQEMKKKLGAEWTDTKLRFLSVWRNEAGTWRMIAWQSLRPAGNSVVPPK